MCFLISSREGDIKIERINETVYLYSSGRSSVAILVEFTPKEDIETVDILYPNKTVETIDSLSDKIKQTVYQEEELVDQEGELEKIRNFEIFEPFSELEHQRILSRIGATGFRFYTISFDEVIEEGETIYLPLLVESGKASKINPDTFEKEIDFTISGPCNVRRSFEKGIEKVKQDFLESPVPIDRLSHILENLESTIKGKFFSKNVFLEQYELGMIFEPGARSLSLNKEGIERVDTLRTQEEDWPEGGMGEYHEFIYSGEGEELSKSYFRVGGNGTYEKMMKKIVFIGLPILAILVSFILSVFF